MIRLTRSGRRIKDGKISKEVFDLDKYQQKNEKKKRDKVMLEQSYEEEYFDEFIDDEGQVVRVRKKVYSVPNTIRCTFYFHGISEIERCNCTWETPHNSFTWSKTCSSIISERW